MATWENGLRGLLGHLTADPEALSALVSRFLAPQETAGAGDGRETDAHKTTPFAEETLGQGATAGESGTDLTAEWLNAAGLSFPETEGEVLGATPGTPRDGDGTAEAGTAVGAQTEGEEVLAAAGIPEGPGDRESAYRRKRAMLSALRPFMTPERSRMIERILQGSELWHLLNHKEATNVHPTKR